MTDDERDPTQESIETVQGVLFIFAGCLAGLGIGVEIAHQESVLLSQLLGLIAMLLALFVLVIDQRDRIPIELYPLESRGGGA